MSDPTETVAQVGLGAAGGISVTAAVAWLVKRIVAKGDTAEEALAAAMRAELIALRTELNAVKEAIPNLATKERVDGALKEHALKQEKDHDMVIDHESRLRNREGLQGVQHTGVHTLSPEMQAIVSRFKETP